VSRAPDDAELKRLQSTLGYRFSEPALLRTALTHRSHSHEQRENRLQSYERLEFLGDALLGFLAAEWLYRDDEAVSEGVLSGRRQSVVRTSTLAGVASELGLGEAVRLGKGEERTGGRAKASLLADTFESVLGAIYLDGGIRPARAFVRRHLSRLLKSTRQARGAVDDHKTRLQEAVQARLQRTPRYRIVSKSGPDHASEFVAEVVVDGRVLGSGKGKNRKLAEQEAARRALGSLRDLGESTC
jgi:ribonuclease-3